MMGSTHAATGALAGLVTLPLAPVTGPGGAAAWVAVWAGAALVPDLDTHGSSAARIWGPPTRLAGAAIGRAARGHRAGTHDIVAAPLAAIGVFAVAGMWAPAAVLAVAVLAGLAQVALDPLIPGDGRHSLTNLVLSFGFAYVVVVVVGVSTWWVPFAVAGGVVVHILGDALTTSGVPVPGAWLLPVPRRDVPSWGLRWFDTGKRFERRRVAPAVDFLVALAAVGNVALVVAA